MIRTILSIALLTSFVAAPLQADPPSNKRKETTKKAKPLLKIAPAPELKEGWSLVNGVWTHSDGYQFVKGQVIRVGTQTHKKPPKSPTKAEMDAATKKNTRPQTPAATAAAKAAEREKNLRPMPAPQTGTHM